MSAEITPQELAALFEDDDDTVEAGACDAFDTADDNILADNEHAHDAVDDDYGDILADEDDSNGANQQKGPAVGDLHLDLDGEPSDANGDDLGQGHESVENKRHGTELAEPPNKHVMVAPDVPAGIERISQSVKWPPVWELQTRTERLLAFGHGTLTRGNAYASQHGRSPGRGVAGADCRAEDIRDGQTQ